MKAVSGVFSIVAGLIAMINFILFLSFVLDRLSQALPGLSRQVRDLIVDAFSQPPRPGRPG